MGYSSENCLNYRNQLDYGFSKTNTSILNIYDKCYYQDLGYNPKNTRLTVRSQMLRGELSCDDNKGAM